MTTEINVPFTRFNTTWESIRQGNPNTFQIMKAFWIAYLISRDEKFLTIIQKIVSESPQVIYDNVIHKIIGEPQKDLDTFLTLDKKKDVIDMWIHAIERIEHLDDFGFYILRKSGVIPDIKQEDSCYGTPIQATKRLIRHRIIFASPHPLSDWFRINFEEDRMITSILSKPDRKISLPPIAYENNQTTLYLVIHPNTSIIWHPVKYPHVARTYAARQLI